MDARLPAVRLSCPDAAAWLAGRPALDLALLYVAQGEYFHDLARSVPNMWRVLRVVAPHLPYGLGVLIGLALAVLAVVIVAASAHDRLDDPSVSSWWR